jgi:hypothetical protein
MNPKIWSELPFDLIERVASFADFDARRALGFPPRKLPKSDFVPRPIAPTTFRYFAALKKLLYINFDESYDVFMWEVYEDITPVAEGEAWIQGPNGSHRGVWRGLDRFMEFDKTEGHFPFHFAGVPEIISA